VLSIALLGRGARAADYYVTRQAGCELDYYLGRGERAGVWLGGGAHALGLEGSLTTEGVEQLRLLLSGRDLTGALVAPPVWRSDPRSHVPAAPLLRALGSLGGLRHPLVAETVGAGLHKALERAELDVARDLRRGSLPRASVSATRAARTIAALGLDEETVFADYGGAAMLTSAVAASEERVDVRRSGVDVTLSAPKSVSVLFALGDPSVSAQVRAAHDVALRQCLEYLEEQAARLLRGHNTGSAERRIASDGLVAVAFEHRSSRCSDPQLHTHVVIANMARGVDGRWSALDTRAVFSHGSTAGYLYQAVLRGELSRRLGVRWGPVRNGLAEIDGVAPGLRRLFSQRRQQIEQALEHSHGHDEVSAKEAQAATLQTRPAKPLAEATTLREGWLKRAAAAGFDARKVLAHALYRDRPARVTAEALVGQVTEQVLAPTGLTSQRSTFDRRGLLRAVCQSAPPSAVLSVSQLRGVAAAVLRSTHVVRLAAPEGPQNTTQAEHVDAATGSATESRRHSVLGDSSNDGSVLFSTTELIETEQRAIAAATARALTGGARVPAIVVEPILKAGTLSRSQQSLVRDLCLSGAGVQAVVGPAGSGKTAALAALAAVHQSQARPIRGVAVAAIAAHGLQSGAGIASTTVAQLLACVQRENSDTDDAGAGVAPLRPPRRPTLEALLPRGSVLVVDEAGMVGTRHLAKLLDVAQEREVSVVLVGDPRQLPEIDAGGLFAALAQRLPTRYLLGNQRQTQQWEQHALNELRDGDVLKAVDAYDDASRLHLHADAADVHAGVLRAYQAADSGGRDILVLAGSRAQVRELNAAVRAQRAATGALTGPVVHLAPADSSGERTAPSPSLRPDVPSIIQQGDRLLVTRNRRDLGLHNGSRGVVTAVRRDRVRLTVDERHVWLSRSELASGLVQYGYAMTCHRAQGVTTDVCLFVASGALTREVAYVAMSRGRLENHLFTTAATVVTLAGDQTSCDYPASATETPQELPPKSVTRLDREARDRSPLDKTALARLLPGHGTREGLEALRGGLTERLERSGAHRLATSYRPAGTRRHHSPVEDSLTRERV
jgi:conjugative relaxase-like TrwC/TraI family protein